MLMRPKNTETAVHHMDASNQAYYFMVDLRGKARKQRSHGAHYRSFKLAASTFVLSILLGV